MYGIFELSLFNIGVLIVVAIVAALIALTMYTVLVCVSYAIALLAMAFQAISVVTTIVLLITYYTSVGWDQGGGIVAFAAIVVNVIAVICHSFMAMIALDFLKGD